MGVQGSSGHGDRSATISRGSTTRTSSMPPTRKTSSSSRCSIHIGCDSIAAPAIRPSPSNSDATSGPGHAVPAELFEHHDAVGPRETVGPQREHARGRELVEQRPVESGAHALDRNPRREHRRDAVAQRDLVVGEVEIHYRGSRGRPSTRSPMMLRWICEAPAAIVSASVRNRSSTSSLSSTCNAPRGPAPSGRARRNAGGPRSRRASSPSRPGRRSRAPTARRCAS